MIKFELRSFSALERWLTCLRHLQGAHMQPTISRRAAIAGALASGIGLTVATPSLAQGWPTRNIRLIVPAAAGSVPDALARVVGEALARRLGQPIAVDNRPGAGGIVAMQELARSAPDGYTLGLGTISQAVFNSYVFPSLAYDPRRDLLPLARLVTSSFVLASHPSVAAASLSELIDLSKRESGKLMLGVPASGSPPHVAAVLMMQETGLSATVVPFRGGPAALTAAIRGDVQLIIDGPTILAPQVSDRALRAIVGTAARRTDALVETPTLAEAGFKSAECESWMGLFAPRGLSAEVSAILAREIQAVMDDAATASRLHALGLLPAQLAAATFSDLIEAEHRRWSPVLQKAALKPD
jgi:tripartite-type tricarboxylate transporter receptor subunit TctC